MDITIPIPMPKKYQKLPDRMQFFVEGFQDAHDGHFGSLGREDQFKRTHGPGAWKAYTDGRTAAEEYMEGLAAGTAGHAPADVRRDFLGYLEDYWTANDSTWEEVPMSHAGPSEGRSSEREWDTQTVRYRLGYLSGRLVACMDTLPDWACDMLGSPHGSPCSEGARLVQERISGS